MVELEIVPELSHETVRQTLKKGELYILLPSCRASVGKTPT
jgi:hypothetical protein